MKSPIYINQNSMQQKSSIYHKTKDGIYKITVDNKCVKCPDEDVIKISNLVKDEANAFLNIEPNWENVNNQIFIGDPRGKYMGTEYLDAEQLGMEAVSDAELNLVEAVLASAKYVYETKELL